MISLPRKLGFPQRHNAYPAKTRYLGWLETNDQFIRSAVTLPSIRKDLKSYGNKSRYDFDSDPLMRQAISLAAQKFKIPKVKMLHLNDVFDRTDLEIWSSSPCLPWKQLGYKTKNDIRRDPDAIRSVRYFWHLLKHGKKIYPPDSQCHVRAHIRKQNEVDKVRAVWGYPATITFGEAMFAVPLIDAYKLIPSPIAYGYETAIGGIYKIIKEAKGEFKTGLDLKSFDKLAPNYLIEKAFYILAQNIDFSAYQGHGVASVNRNYRMYEFIKEYFVNTPVRMCNGERYLKKSGIASGSYFTQLIDSVVNYIIVVWLTLRQHRVPPVYIKVLGDDSIITTNQLFDLSQAQDDIETLGMSLNRKKSISSRNWGQIQFLGYTMENGLPHRPFDQWLGTLCYPERTDRSISDFMTRVVGLCYANCGVCTPFDEFCRIILDVGSKVDWTLQVDQSFARYLRSHGIMQLNRKPPEPIEFLLRLL